MRTLNTYVHAVGENGESQVFGPGDVLPDWARKAITNPKVWDGEDNGVGIVDAEQAKDDLGYSEQPSEAPVPLERPQGNASKKTWAAYASQEGVDLEDDMTRDDIIAAVDLSKE